jgi:hypothetical protein
MEGGREGRKEGKKEERKEGRKEKRKELVTLRLPIAGISFIAREREAVATRGTSQLFLTPQTTRWPC